MNIQEMLENILDWLVIFHQETEVNTLDLMESILLVMRHELGSNLD